MSAKRKILCLGATSAIAAETLKLFARDGDEFYLVARDEKKLSSVVADLVARGAARIEKSVADLSDFDRHSKLFSDACEKLSGIDLVLVAHGVLGDQRACEKNYQETEKNLRANLLSVISFITPVANYFEGRGTGCIAVISSVAGDRGRQSNYIYGTAKGALSIFLQGLRNRLFKKGVHVLTIKPGFVDTPMTSGFKKGALFVGPEVIARGIYNAIDRKRDVVYLPWFWWVIMEIITSIPERIFKRLKL